MNANGESASGLETKFCRAEPVTVSEGTVIEGYASLFGAVDHGNDCMQRGAFTSSLRSARPIRMLWQHDPREPIGVWDEVHEDEKGLWVKGRLLPEVTRGREAAVLIAAGAIDGLSIGFRTKRAERDQKGRRLLTEVELWEVSLVTFPMLGDARAEAKGDAPEADVLRELAAAFEDARRTLAAG